MGLEEYIKDVPTDDAAEQASNLRSMINILWGMLLYERSVVEFKLGLLMWEDCLMVAIEKFKFGGASATDIAMLVKNHYANKTAQDGKRNLLFFSIFFYENYDVDFAGEYKNYKGIMQSVN
jgi:hypothetical protein